MSASIQSYFIWPLKRENFLDNVLKGFVLILGGHPKCTTRGHLKMYQGSVGT